MALSRISCRTSWSQKSTETWSLSQDFGGKGVRYCENSQILIFVAPEVGTIACVAEIISITGIFEKA